MTNDKIDTTGDNYLRHLDDIATEDVKGLKKAQESYGNSWKRRGGVGAFMMLARKWDRLENALRPKSVGDSDHQNTMDLADSLEQAKIKMHDLHSISVCGTKPQPNVVEFNPPGMPSAHAEAIRRLLTKAPPFDIFAAAMVDQRSEGIIDDIRDLRRYLMLVEAEIRSRGVNPQHRDNYTDLPGVTKPIVRETTYGVLPGTQSIFPPGAGSSIERPSMPHIMDGAHGISGKRNFNQED